MDNALIDRNTDRLREAQEANGSRIGSLLYNEIEDEAVDVFGSQSTIRAGFQVLLSFFDQEFLGCQQCRTSY